MTTEELLRRADAWLSEFHNKGGVTVPDDSYLALIRDLAAALRAEMDATRCPQCDRLRLELGEQRDRAERAGAERLFWKERCDVLEKRIKWFTDAGGVSMATRIYDVLRERDVALAILRKAEYEIQLLREVLQESDISTAAIDALLKEIP